MVFFIFTYLISGTGIFFRKNWARLLAIIQLLVFLVFVIINACVMRYYDAWLTGVIIASMLSVYHLTRPKVKEQFKTEVTNG